MENIRNNYKLSYPKEPYQPLSELVKKLEQCTSKSLTSLVASSVSEKEISTEHNIPSLPIPTRTTQIVATS